MTHAGNEDYRIMGQIRHELIGGYTLDFLFGEFNRRLRRLKKKGITRLTTQTNYLVIARSAKRDEATQNAHGMFYLGCFGLRSASPSQ